MFALTKKKLIMTDDNLCIEAHKMPTAVLFSYCDESLKNLDWDFDFQVEIYLLTISVKS